MGALFEYQLSTGPHGYCNPGAADNLGPTSNGRPKWCVSLGMSVMLVNKGNLTSTLQPVQHLARPLKTRPDVADLLSMLSWLLISG